MIPARPELLRFEQARSRFMPHFIKDEKAFHEQMGLWINRFRGAGEPIEWMQISPFEIEIHCHGVCLYFDANSYQLSIRRSDDDTSLARVVDGFDNPFGPPEKFFDMQARVEPLPEFIKGFRTLVELAERMFSLHHRYLYRAIMTGRAIVFGRWRSPSACLEEVTASQWAYLRIDEPELHEDLEHYLPASARYEDLRLFDIHIKSNESHLRSKGTDVVSDALEALIDEMTAQPKASTENIKGIVETRYLADFPTLSATSFRELVWPVALEAVPACKWGRPGRRIAPDLTSGKPKKKISKPLQTS